MNTVSAISKNDRMPTDSPDAAFLESAVSGIRSETESRRLAVLAKTLSSHPLVGAYMRMKASDPQFLRKLEESANQISLQWTMFARFEAETARVQIKSERLSGREVSFLSDSWVRAVGEAQLASLFRRKKAELSRLKGVPVSKMSVSEHGNSLQAVQLLAASKTMVKYALNFGDPDFESMRAVEFVRFLEILWCTAETEAELRDCVGKTPTPSSSVESARGKVVRTANVSERASSGVVRNTVRKIMAVFPFFRNSPKEGRR